MSQQSPLSGRAGSLVRYLDVSVVIAVAPVFALGKLPVLGYIVGALAWLATRYGFELAQRRARVASLPRQTAILLAAMMGRVFALVGAVLIARFAGNTDDGIAAACVLIVAFTVQLLINLATRGGGYGARPGGSSRGGGFGAAPGGSS